MCAKGTEAHDSNSVNAAIASLQSNPSCRLSACSSVSCDTVYSVPSPYGSSGGIQTADIYGPERWWHVPLLQLFDSDWHMRTCLLCRMPYISMHTTSCRKNARAATHVQRDVQNTL
jgi:hypothetical protein